VKCIGSNVLRISGSVNGANSAHKFLMLCWLWPKQILTACYLLVLVIRCQRSPVSVLWVCKRLELST